jgi:hypothetical protein
MGRFGIAGGIDSMTEQVKERTGVFGMKTKERYFRWRGTYPIEKTTPARALAERNIDENKLDLVGGKGRKHRFCFIDSSAQMNRKISRLQLLGNRRWRRFYRLNDQCEGLWHPKITLVIASRGE